MQPMMRLVAMRHGETDWNREKRLQGSKDVPLNATGERQIEQVSEFFLRHSGYGFSRIVASPLMRARQSAAICSRLLGIPYALAPEFSERWFGMLEGKTWKEIQDQYDIPDIEEIGDARYGIEPAFTVWERVRRCLDRLYRNYRRESVLLVTHGSIIKYIAGQQGTNIGIINNAEYLELNPICNGRLLL